MKLKFALVIICFPTLCFGNICSNLFDHDFTGTIFPKEFLQYSILKVSDTQSVRLTDEVLKENGDTFNVLEKTGKYWESSFRISKNDVQGDPRFFAIVLGPKVAYDFGFRYLSDNKMTVPTTETFNSKIQKLDQSLRALNLEGISIRFYESGGKPSTDEEYLRKFAERHELPLGQEGNVAVHDLDYHTLAILIPSRLLETAVQSITFILHMKQDLQNDTQLSVEEKKIALDLSSVLVGRGVQYLDSGTGSLSKILAEKISDPLFLRKSENTFNSFVTENLQNNFYRLASPEKIHELILTSPENFGKRRIHFLNISKAVARIYNKRNSEVPQQPKYFAPDQALTLLENRINMFKLFSNFGKIE
jgi:hypothetical protein